MSKEGYPAERKLQIAAEPAIGAVPFQAERGRDQVFPDHQIPGYAH